MYLCRGLLKNAGTVCKLFAVTCALCKAATVGPHHLCNIHMQDYVAIVLKNLREEVVGWA